MKFIYVNLFFLSDVKFVPNKNLLREKALCIFP